MLNSDVSQLPISEEVQHGPVLREEVRPVRSVCQGLGDLQEATGDLRELHEAGRGRDSENTSDFYLDFLSRD